MELYIIFNTILCVEIAIIMILIVKTIYVTINLKKVNHNNCNKLKNKLQNEIKKSQSIAQKIILINSLEKALYVRIFKIVEGFISLQKFIFEKNK